jgi:hypothetical protein
LKQIVIELSRCTLILSEAELLQVIPPSLLEKGIKQGKAYKRATEFKKRMERSND